MQEYTAFLIEGYINNPDKLEEERLKELVTFGIIGSSRENNFDIKTNIWSIVFRALFNDISFIDEKRTYLKSATNVLRELDSIEMVVLFGIIRSKR